MRQNTCELLWETQLPTKHPWSGVGHAESLWVKVAPTIVLMLWVDQLAMCNMKSLIYSNTFSSSLYLYITSQHHFIFYFGIIVLCNNFPFSSSSSYPANVVTRWPEKSKSSTFRTDQWLHSWYFRFGNEQPVEKQLVLSWFESLICTKPALTPAWTQHWNWFGEKGLRAALSRLHCRLGANGIVRVYSAGSKA